MPAEIANHLWQSTVLAAVVWLLTLALRKNRAAVRYGLWLAASVKFLLPFSLLVSAGSLVEWRSIPAIPAPAFSRAVERISQPFAAPAPVLPIGTETLSPSPIPELLFVLWFCGFAISAIVWFRLWRRFQAALRLAKPVSLNLPIAVMTSPGRLEPGVVGIRKPVLLLPEGIEKRLTPAQLQSILMHELCHVRRRDNLAAAIHMLVEAIFWFHPLVWWIGTRLVEERERACDEEVVRLGSEPQVYAEGILNVCKLYLQSPLTCASGVTGSNLRKRIEAILNHRAAPNLTLAKKAALMMAAAIAVLSPVAMGILNAPFARAQSKAQSFEVASIKRSVVPVGREGGNRSRIEHTPTSLTMSNVALRECVQWAYGVAPFQVSAAQLSSDSYDIRAKAGAAVPVSQLRIMLQDLLAKRFRLALHREVRMLPVYELVAAKGGPRLPPPNAVTSGPLVHAAESLPRIEGDSFLFADASMAEFAQMLTQLRGIDLPVVDRTGIAGTFDIVLKSAPSVTREGDSAALFAIIQSQLGLRLVPAKAPMEVVVIDRAEKPSEN